jgi:hypothetical protein
MQRRFGRQAAIDQLVDHTLESIHQDPDGELLREMVRRGFFGFEGLTDSRLEAELQMRGLSSAPLPQTHDDEEAEDEPSDEHEIIDILSPRLLRSPAEEGAD